MKISEDNIKLIKDFGATPIKNLKKVPEFYTFKKGLIVSHRDFDKFLEALEKGEKCAIVSGLNPSGVLHLGHKVVFDTNLYFQKKYNLPVFIPLSDDESYVSGKVKTQEEALENAYKLAKELIAYGFNPKKTYFIIDQVYTNIYNLAIKLSVKLNLSEIKATYGYEGKDNIGIQFYPVIQSAHILFPNEKFNIKNILVPIGPDEDAHIRISRDIASRMNYKKPSILHLNFMPGIDGKKMSASKNNSIFLEDDEKKIINKIKGALSGGQKTKEQHRKIGGNPEVDMAFQYLSAFFISEKESERISKEYKEGKLLSSEIKDMLIDFLKKDLGRFQENLNKISDKDVENSILKNEK